MNPCAIRFICCGMSNFFRKQLVDLAEAAISPPMPVSSFVHSYSRSETARVFVNAVESVVEEGLVSAIRMSLEIIEPAP